MKKLAVLVSGRGSNLAAMLEYGLMPALVLADRPAPAMDIADDYAVRTALIDRNEFGYAGPGTAWDRAGFTHRIVGRLRQAEIELVAMAGFMTILDPLIFTVYGGHIINLHPSLLPLFPGSRAVEEALEAGVEVTGTTIHVATDILDDATFILAQATVPILPGDTSTTLSNRIRAVEHKLYPKIIFDILSGRRDLPRLQT